MDGPSLCGGRLGSIIAYNSFLGCTESTADIRLYLLRLSSVYHSDSYVSLSTYVTTNPVQGVESEHQRERNNSRVPARDDFGPALWRLNVFPVEVEA